jgi:hypothetical protein
MWERKIRGFVIFLSHIFLSGGRNDDQGHGFRYDISEFERCPKINIGVVESPPAGALEDASESRTPAPSTLSPSHV